MKRIQAIFFVGICALPAPALHAAQFNAAQAKSAVAALHNFFASPTADIEILHDHLPALAACNRPAPVEPADPLFGELMKEELDARLRELDWVFYRVDSESNKDIPHDDAFVKAKKWTALDQLLRSPALRRRFTDEERETAQEALRFYKIAVVERQQALISEMRSVIDALAGTASAELAASDLGVESPAVDARLASRSADKRTQMPLKKAFQGARVFNAAQAAIAKLREAEDPPYKHEVFEQLEALIRAHPSDEGLHLVIARGVIDNYQDDRVDSRLYALKTIAGASDYPSVKFRIIETLVEEYAYADSYLPALFFARDIALSASAETKDSAIQLMQAEKARTKDKQKQNELQQMIDSLSSGGTQQQEEKTKDAPVPSRLKRAWEKLIRLAS